MRARGVVHAALAALVGILAACRGDLPFDVNVNVFQDQWQGIPPGPVIVTDTTITGSCPVQVMIAVVGLPNIVGDTLYMTPPGSTADVRGQAFGTCVTSQAFRWESENPAVGAVVSIDSSTGRITAIARGVAGIQGIHIQTGARARFVVKVTEAAGTVSVTPHSVVFSSGAGCTVFGQQFQYTSTPAGLSGTWSSTGHIAGSSQSGGMYTFVSNASGTDTVRFALPNGTSDFGVITVNANACVNPPTPTSISIVPNPDSYPVGTVKTPTVTVTYSDGSTKVNQSGTFNCVSSAANIVSVNSATCQETGVTAGGTSITACATSTVCAVQAVTVTSGATISVNPTSLSMSGGDNTCPATSTFTVSVTNVASPTLSVASSAQGVATVSVGNPSTSGSVTTWVVTVSRVSIGSSNMTVSVNGYPSLTTVVPVTVTSATCAGARVDSVTLRPPSWSLVFGGQDSILTAVVWGTPGISQAISSFGNSQPGCVQITQIGNNQIRVHALMGCTTSITLTATSAVDPTKTGTSVGTTSSGILGCAVSDSTTGARLDSTTVVMPSGVDLKVVLVTCNNQFGVQFRPFGESNHAEIAAILGTSWYNYGGVNWPAGPYFHITRVGAGTARITFHVAVTDQTVIDWFDITFP